MIEILKLWTNYFKNMIFPLVDIIQSLQKAQGPLVVVFRN